MNTFANSDFSRIITLLRKERGLSQKQAATDLKVSQALLSHYEKGIRECGLDFLVKTADYYGVSCDYLLGRSPEPQGRLISYEELEEPDPSQKDSAANRGALALKGGMMAVFNRKLIINSMTLFYNLLQKCGSDTLMREISSFLMLAIYRAFRVVFMANPKNDINFFSVPETLSLHCADAAMSICEANAVAAAKGQKLQGEDVAAEDAPLINAATLEAESNLSTSLLNLIKNSEARIQMLRLGGNR